MSLSSSSSSFSSSPFFGSSPFFVSASLLALLPTMPRPCRWDVPPSQTNDAVPALRVSSSAACLTVSTRCSKLISLTESCRSVPSNLMANRSDVALEGKTMPQLLFNSDFDKPFKMTLSPCRNFRGADGLLPPPSLSPPHSTSLVFATRIGKSARGLHTGGRCSNSKLLSSVLPLLLLAMIMLLCRDCAGCKVQASIPALLLHAWPMLLPQLAATNTSSSSSSGGNSSSSSSANAPEPAACC
mmetsp:Transcript_38941/g.100893  ORF Transcript_38941/g.100893 Transcript_38941/m.100893 type:complete len:242 (+) Transcript_38941:111-836(+)